LSVEISLNVEIYKSWKSINRRIIGQEVTPATSGYVYVFVMQRRSGGLMVTLFATCSMPGVINLPVEEKNDIPLYYFFAYSRIEFSEKRKSVIMDSIKDFIEDPEKNIYCRVQYIAFINQAVALSYCRGTNISENVICIGEGKIPVIKIRLHDWYGYLEELTNRYQEELKKYIDFIDEEVSLENYIIDKKFKYTNLTNQRFKRDDLSKLAKMADAYIKELKDETSLEVLRNEILPLKDTQGKICKYHYELVNEEVNRTFDETKKQIQPYANAIIELYTDSLRRIHATLIDYAFSEEEKDKKDMVELVGKSLERIYIFLEEDKVKLFEDVIDQLADICDEAVKQDTITEDDQIDEVYKKGIKETSVFTYTTIFDIIGVSTSGFFYILDTIYNFCEKEIHIRPIYIAIDKYHLKGLPNSRRAMFDTNKEQIEKWYNHRHEKSARANNFEDIRSEWAKIHTELLQEAYPGKTIEITEYTRVTKSEPKTYWRMEVIKPSILNENIRKEFKKGIEIGGDIAEKIGGILNWFNVCQDIDAIRRLFLEYPDEDLKTSVISLSSSMVSIFEKKAINGLHVLWSNSNNQLVFRVLQSLKGRSNITSAGLVGAVGLWLSAFLNFDEANESFGGHDDDAGLMYALSATMLLSAGIVTLFFGPISVVTIGTSVVSLVLNLYADSLKDGPIEIFLKRSVWGISYNTPQTSSFPSWYPLNDDYDSKESFIIRFNLGVNVNPNIALSLSILQEQIIGRHIFMSRVVQQILPYELNLERSIPVGSIYCSNHLELRLYTGMSFFYIDSIIIDFFTEKKSGFWSKGGPVLVVRKEFNFDTIVRDDSIMLEDADMYGFLATKEGKGIAANDKEILKKADMFQCLFIDDPSKFDRYKAEVSMMGYRTPEFKMVCIREINPTFIKRVTVTINCKYGLFPVEITEYTDNVLLTAEEVSRWQIGKK
jgi:hypothetical protein